MPEDTHYRTFTETIKSITTFGFAFILASASGAVYAGTAHVALDIPGMDCPACPLTIKIALKQVNGVQSIEVDYKSRRASVAFDDARATLEDLRKATAGAGYPSMLAKGNGDGRRYPRIHVDLPALQSKQHRNNADRRLPVLPFVHDLRRAPAAQARRLLRLLLVWVGQVPTDAGRKRLLFMTLA